MYRGTQVAPAFHAPERIQESDDLHITIQPGFILTNREAPAWVEFQFVGDSFADELKRFTVESYANTPGLTATVEILNWTTNEWEEIAQFQEAFADLDSVEECDIPLNRIDYISAALEVRTRIGWLSLIHI